LGLMNSVLSQSLRFVPGKILNSRIITCSIGAT
jgi:hypothetical protein